jgi:hypothetical protein
MDIAENVVDRLQNQFEGFRDTDNVQKQLRNLRGLDWEKYAYKDEDTSSLSFFSGLLLGLVVGAIVALILAPQPGRDTREQVVQTGIELLPTSGEGEDVEI